MILVRLPHCKIHYFVIYLSFPTKCTDARDFSRQFSFSLPLIIPIYRRDLF